MLVIISFSCAHEREQHTKVTKAFERTHIKSKKNLCFHLFIKKNTADNKTNVTCFSYLSEGPSGGHRIEGDFELARLLQERVHHLRRRVLCDRHLSYMSAGWTLVHTGAKLTVSRGKVCQMWDVKNMRMFDMEMNIKNSSVLTGMRCICACAMRVCGR